DKGRIEELLAKGEVDMVTFTSSSTVVNFVEMFQDEDQRLREWMAEVTVACIGPITAKTARENGLEMDLIPEKYTIESLTHAIVRHFSSAP
ncbi:MAG: uroporphyrinogen-III synthase, partial [Deltaproteobacteria bacterium]|nr:uroporphyrinogen-III synthase [Deltaproteobacteria bacterium]